MIMKRERQGPPQIRLFALSLEGRERKENKNKNKDQQKGGEEVEGMETDS